MKKSLPLTGLCLFSFFCIAAQDAIDLNVFNEGSATETGKRIYLENPVRLPDKRFQVEIIESPDTRLVSLHYRDEKLRVKDGWVVGYNTKGDTQFISYYHRNRLNGKWMSWFENRQLCDSGAWVKDYPNGEWKGWYPDGTQRFIYHFNAEKLAALKNEISRQPKIRFFRISREPAAKAVRYYQSGYALDRNTDYKAPLFPFARMNRKKYNELALKSIIDQNTKAYASSLYQPPFSECLLDGTYTTYYPDGSIRETGEYVNGLREGLWEVYLEPNGTKVAGTYVHDQRKGEWRTYLPNGKLAQMEIYDGRGKVREYHSFKRSR